MITELGPHQMMGIIRSPIAIMEAGLVVSMQGFYEINDASKGGLSAESQGGSKLSLGEESPLRGGCF
ncbi:MAG: hypothetical protein EA402_12515 [Planctomycetota bacterium]|nr:MAG: hypothetical protein EA402_12515 [Planctomycetota bacterium]